MEGYGEIYLVKSPCNKYYIGQALCVLSNGKQYGTYERWKGHLSDAKCKNGGNCRILNHAINKYDQCNFDVHPILTTTIDKLDEYEIYFIEEYKSMDRTFGYNIRNGGRTGSLSQETRDIMSKNRSIKPCFKQKHTEETKIKISQTLISNVERIGHTGAILPKYVKFIDWIDRKGYAVVSHPQCKLKYFVSTKTDPNLDQLYSKCIKYIANLNI